MISKSCVGECPVCGSSDLEFDVATIEDGGVCYPFTCNSCGKDSEEWYDLNYSETICKEKDE